MTATAENLTGGQIQEVLDFLIYRGLEPIVRCSAVFDVQLVYLLGIVSTNKKRKISALERDVCITKLCTALTTSDIDLKLDCISGSKLERGFVYNFLVNFLNAADGYVDLYTKYLTCTTHDVKTALDLRLSAIERTLSFSRNNLFYVLLRCKKYVDLAYEFRNSIVLQYVKHTYRQSHIYCKDKSDNFDVGDVNQSLIAAVTKALDKYDSSKGALTSYINYWMLNTLTYSGANYGHEYGIAYTVPQSFKKSAPSEKTQVNFSVSLNTLLSDDSETSIGDNIVGCEGVESKYIEETEAETLSYLIKRADTDGLARLYLDLAEYISVKEMTRMAKSMFRQLGYYPPEFNSTQVKGLK